MSITKFRANLLEKLAGGTRNRLYFTLIQLNLADFGQNVLVACSEANMNYEGALSGAAQQRVNYGKLGVVKRGVQNDLILKVVSYLFILNPYFIILLFHRIVFGNKWLTYIGEDAVAFVANTSLQTEGQVMAADHDAAAKALLKWLHVRLDA